MERYEVYSALTRIGVKPQTWLLLDELYSCPARDWVLGEFSAALRRNLEALGLTDWLAEGNDCDDFSFMARAFASISQGRTNPKAGLAFGIFIYVTRHRLAHAINVAVIDAGGVLFYEPQLQTAAELTREEIESCTAVII
jgi:hypothetical protein